VNEREEEGERGNIEQIVLSYVEDILLSCYMETYWKVLSRELT
jgi:hypothetical protein